MEALDLSGTFLTDDVCPRETLGVMKGRPPIPMEHPPNRIREVRDRAGLTQRELAKLTGFSYQSLAEWETRVGESENQLSVRKLEHLAGKLGVKAHTLLNDYEPARGAHEERLLSLFRKLSPRERARALDTLELAEKHAQQDEVPPHPIRRDRPMRG